MEDIKDYKHIETEKKVATMIGVIKNLNRKRKFKSIFDLMNKKHKK